MTYPTATIETSKGTITVELWDDVAPKHAENFQKLAKVGFMMVWFFIESFLDS